MSERDDGGDTRRWWSSWIRVITRLEIALAAGALVLMFVLVLIQAGQRYLPVTGWAWTGELARFCLVWLTFTVAGVLVSTDSHITLQLVDALERPGLVRVVRVIAATIVAIVGAGFALEAWDLMTSQGRLKSPSLRMPLVWLYVLPFLGFLSTTVRSAVVAVRFALHGVPPGPEPEEVRPG